MSARDVLASVTGYCDACGAGPGVVCDPFCMGVAAVQDKCPPAWSFAGWTLTPEVQPGYVYVTAASPSGRGSYACFPEVGVVVLTMGRAKLNRHMRTERVRMILTGAFQPCDKRRAL